MKNAVKKAVARSLTPSAFKSTLHPEGFVRLVASHPILQSLSHAEVTKICATALHANLSPGELLYKSGDPASHVYLLLRGAMQIEYPAAKKTHGRVVAILAAPAILGECQALNDRHWTGTGVALTDMVVVGFTSVSWARLLRAHHSVAEKAYFELTRRFLRTLESFRQSPDLTPEPALARYILGVLSALDEKGREKTMVLPLDQRSMASAAGLGRETTNRVIARWRKQGIVTVRPNQLVIEDTAALERLMAEVPESLLVQNTMSF